MYVTCTILWYEVCIFKVYKIVNMSVSVCKYSFYTDAYNHLSYIGMQ